MIEGIAGRFRPARLKSRLKPLYFSPVARPLRVGLGRAVSGLGLGENERDAIVELIGRVPGELGARLSADERHLLSVLADGSGMSPISHWRLLRWLGEGFAEGAREHSPAPRAPYDGRRLRLLFVTSIFPSVRHGGGLRIFDLIRALSNRHEVSLYSLFGSNHDKESWQALLPTLAASRIVEADSFSERDLSAWLAGRGHARFDAIHTVWPGIEPVLPILRGRTNRLVYEIAECVTRRAAMDCARGIAEGRPEIVGPALFQLVEGFRQESSILGRVHGAFALTETDAQFARALFGGETPAVLPTGVSDYAVMERARTLPDPDGGLSLPPSAIFIGFYGHPPNLEGMEWYLTKVHPLVTKRVPGFRMRVAGIGDISRLRRLSVGDPTVEFLGEVPDVVTALRSSRISLAPLVSGAGIRLKMNQYAAAGRPAVSTSIGVCGTPYRDEEAVLVADEPALFAEKMVRLLTDPELYSRLRDAARAIVEKRFSWQGLLPEYEAYYGG